MEAFPMELSSRSSSTTTSRLGSLPTIMSIGQVAPKELLVFWLCHVTLPGKGFAIIPVCWKSNVALYLDNFSDMIHTSSKLTFLRV